MKRIWLTVLGLATLGIAPAIAADLPARTYTKAPPPAPQPSWAGFYLGVNGGGALSQNCWDFTNFFGVLPVPPIREGCHDATGGVVGGQVGYRWQAADWVFGLEAQGDWADLKGSNTSQFLVGPPAVVNQTKTDAIGLFTGQVGYAWNGVLGYVKGGAAVTHNKYNGLAAGVVGDQASDTRWGGAAGAGLEFGIGPGWSLALEYDHLFMGRRNVTMTAVGLPIPLTTRIDRIEQNVDMATVRVNYRFGGPVVARY